MKKKIQKITSYYVDKVPHVTREVGSFWWKDVFRLHNLYRGVARCSIGDGSTVLFWDDAWSQEVLSNKYPHLFSFAHSDHSSVKHIMDAQDLESIFFLPLTLSCWNYKSTCNRFHTRWKRKTSGHSFGELLIIHQVECTSMCSQVCRCHKPSSFYGRLEVCSELRSLPGFS